MRSQAIMIIFCPSCSFYAWPLPYTALREPCALVPQLVSCLIRLVSGIFLIIAEFLVFTSRLFLLPEWRTSFVSYSKEYELHLPGDRIAPTSWP